MDKYNLRPLWDAILNIYMDFAAVCDRHGLRYYATGGTALGAIRHSGFIPWDDDFDLVMPRPDYIKFMTLYYKELSPSFQAKDYHFDTNYSLMFGKVYETRTEIIKTVSIESNLNLNQGIFIDIIPIDGMPKKKIPFYIWLWGRMTWRRYVCSNTEHIGLLWKISSRFWNIPRNKNDVRTDFESWLNKWDFDSSPAVDDYNTNARRLRHRILKASTFGTPKMVQFDKLLIPVPSDVELFLSEIFGDWRKLPPKDKQIPSHQTLQERS